MGHSVATPSDKRDSHAKSKWENLVVLRDELSCVREIGNPHDPTYMAVVVKKEIGGEIRT